MGSEGKALLMKAAVLRNLLSEPPDFTEMPWRLLQNMLDPKAKK